MGYKSSGTKAEITGYLLVSLSSSVHSSLSNLSSTFGILAVCNLQCIYLLAELQAEL